MSTLIIDGREKRINSTADLEDTLKGHELAKNFRGRNVVSMLIAEGGEFVHAGYGRCTQNSRKVGQ